MLTSAVVAIQHAHAQAGPVKHLVRPRDNQGSRRDHRSPHQRTIKQLSSNSLANLAKVTTKSHRKTPRGPTLRGRNSEGSVVFSFSSPAEGEESGYPAVVPQCIDEAMAIRAQRHGCSCILNRRAKRLCSGTGVRSSVVAPTAAATFDSSSNLKSILESTGNTTTQCEGN